MQAKIIARGEIFSSIFRALYPCAEGTETIPKMHHGFAESQNQFV